MRLSQIKNPISFDEKWGFDIQFMATSILGWRTVYLNSVNQEPVYYLAKRMGRERGEKTKKL
jgi:hypothetical protein